MRQKALKVILCVLLIAFAIDAITAVLNSKRVISISANPAMARSTSEDAVAEVSTLSGDTAHEASEPMAQSPDDIESKIKATFPEDPITAIKLFQKESGLDPSCESNTDRMADGRPFSIGLVQINLTAHRIGSVECHKAFSGKDYTAVVIDEALYEKCVQLAKDPDVSLQKARLIYEGRNETWNAWGAYKAIWNSKK